uniref:Uncharacterized protein LOC100178686 n=1 Tax=Phallusia mammillata TaxID=59560 RepID=A0A6F9DHE0_9ASCI|nr:uncharacterized protein LOC100178686 [Phallusia mammillata]
MQINKTQRFTIRNGNYLLESDNHYFVIMKSFNEQRRHHSTLCDVTLEVEETLLFAHKAVLAACSNYFKIRFSDVKEKQLNDVIMSPKKQRLMDPDKSNSVVRLLGIKLKIFQQVLEYMYTSKITISKENIVDFLITSCLLQIRDLINACIKILLNERHWCVTTKQKEPIRCQSISPAATQQIYKIDLTTTARTITARELAKPKTNISKGHLLSSTPNNGNTASVKSCDSAHSLATGNDFYGQHQTTHQPHQASRWSDKMRRSRTVSEGPPLAHQKEPFDLRRQWIRRFDGYDVAEKSSAIAKKRKVSRGSLIKRQVRSNSEIEKSGNQILSSQYPPKRKFEYNNLMFDPGTYTTMFSDIPPMYRNFASVNPSLIVGDRSLYHDVSFPHHPPAWVVLPHVLNNQRSSIKEPIPLLPRNRHPPICKVTLSPHDVSSIKHPRKRKLMSAAFHDSGTDTDSVGTGSIDSGVALETHKPLCSVSSIDDFPASDVSIASVVSDVTSLRRCEKEVGRHQQCVM